MKKVLIIVQIKPRNIDSPEWGSLLSGLRDKLGADVSVDIASITQLIYQIDGKICSISDSGSGRDIADYDAVVIRTVGKKRELGITIAHYLADRGVPFTDSYLHQMGFGKLSCAFVRTLAGIPSPKTLYSSPRVIRQLVESSELPGWLGFPCVVKADIGKKGRDNYLVNSPKEMLKVVEESGDLNFVIQEFIPNDGDYRIVTMMGVAGPVVKRTAKKGSYLNNTSQGGSAEIVDLTVFNKDHIDLALQAAKTMQLEIAGVDLVINKATGDPYILEVNVAPQLLSGAFGQENLASYAQAIDTLSKRVQK